MNVALAFIEAIGPIFELIKDTELDTYAMEISNAILIRMKDNDEKDADEIDKIGIKNFFKSIRSVLSRILSNDIKDQIKYTMLVERLKSKNNKRRMQAIDILKSEYKIISISNF